jgi:hypothetical protein
MFSSSLYKALCERGGAALLVGLSFLPLGCSKDKEIKHVWDGPAVMAYAKSMPKPRTAAKTDFGAVSLKEGPAKLKVPVDWKQDPYKSKTWQARLHRWQWMWPLLQAWEKSQDKDSLKEAALLALDWVKKNPLQGDKSPVGWKSSNAAWRAQALGYLVRTATDAGVLTAEQQDDLLTSVREHAAWLSNDENYNARVPASLYSDFGLAVMCANLNKLPDCKAWSGIARERFIETANRFFDRGSSVHKDHTPWYHFRQADVVERMAKVAKSPALSELNDKIEKSSNWLSPPDGRQLMFGESNYSKIPRSNVTAGKKLAGVNVLGRSGYAVARQKDSYLFTAASFHSKRRKHADELSFTWLENGDRIIGDSGRANKKQTSLYRYSESARAHNTLTVDGQDFSLSGKPYRSGILGGGSGDGWHAIMGHNPTLARTKVKHYRTWLYRPGELLLVIDRVQSSQKHRYERFFHFWSDLKVDLSEAGLATTNLKKTPIQAFDASGKNKVEAKLLRDEKKPVQGLMFRRYGKSEPDQVLSLVTEGSDVVLGTLFQVGEAKLKPEDVSIEFQDDVYYVTLKDKTLGLSRSKKTVKIELGAEKGKAVAKDKDKDKAADAKPAAGAKPALKAPQPAAPKPAAPKPAAPPAKAP